MQASSDNQRFMDMQEQEALVKELTEVLQRQKTRVAALQKDRAEQGAQLAAYQPAEQDKLRAEMNNLRERVGELAGIKVVLHCFVSGMPRAGCILHVWWHQRKCARCSDSKCAQWRHHSSPASGPYLWHFSKKSTISSAAPSP